MLDERSGVIFYTLINRNAMGCWNSITNANNNWPQSTAILVSDDNALIFPNDIIFDDNENVWLLSDRLPVSNMGNLNANDVNFRLFVAPIRDVVRGTVCDPDYRGQNNAGSGNFGSGTLGSGSFSNIGQGTFNNSQFGNSGSNQSNFGSNQGSFGNSQGNLGNNQGNFGNNQGNFGNNQGNLGNNQGSFGSNQGSFGNNQGSFGNNQGNFGNNQGNLGIRQPPYQRRPSPTNY